MSATIPLQLWCKRRILPGFGLTLGFTVIYLSLIVLIPLSATFLKASGLGWESFFRAVTSARVLASYEISFWISLLAAGVNAVFGVATAWILVRYRFPGRRILDAMVDLPFALPTAVAGIALAAIYSPNGWFGQPILALTGLRSPKFQKQNVYPLRFRILIGSARESICGDHDGQFHPDFPPHLQMFVKEVPRSDATIEELEAEVRKFLAELEAKLALLNGDLAA